MNRREYVAAHQYRYTVLFEPAEEGGYVVTCPSLPGLVTEGDTLQEARANAAEAIRGYRQFVHDHRSDADEVSSYFRTFEATRGNHRNWM